MPYDTNQDAEKTVIALIKNKSSRSRPPGFPGKMPELYDPEEITRLAETAGAEVIEHVAVSLDRVDPAYYIGKGKVAELAGIASEKRAGLFIFDCGLSPAQQGNLEAALDARVIDRSQLILDIFARRAKTNEGKLQVELAQLNYLLPRLRGRGVEMSRLGGGIGTRGPGEMKLETDRRRIKKRINRLNLEIEKLIKHRALGRKERSQAANIALAGYTNSGKSTLLNFLTNSNELSENKPFSTLDSTVRKIELPGGSPAVLIDTVGFIRDLPHNLIAAFKATLEELILADTLVHVVDASDPLCENRFKTVVETIHELGASDKTTVIALNKIDLLEEAERKRIQNIFPDGAPVSAKTGEGSEKLLLLLEAKSPARRIKVRLRLPQAMSGLASRLHDEANILAKEYDGQDIIMEAEVSGQLYSRVKEFLEEK